MKTKNILFAGTAAVVLLASCSASGKLGSRLQGSWKIEAYAEQHHGKEEAGASNIGSITFNEDMTGTKKISYRILKNEIIDANRFSWSNTSKTVTIQGENSSFAKTWIVIGNKKKEQRWKSTDGKGNVQSMTLIK